MNLAKKITGFLNKDDSPRLVIKGACKKCGNCCRNITFIVGEEYLTREEEFERLKSLDSKYNNFYISGKDENGVLLFACKSLREDNLCSCYAFRSLYCRLYPKIKTKHLKDGIEFPEECGYYIESSVSFEEILHNTYKD